MFEININEINDKEGWTGNINGVFVAVYNDNENYIVLKNYCTHLHCQTKWNDKSKTWNCPCHGSQYKFDGSLIHGPARKPLKKIGHSIVDNKIILTE